MRRCSATTCIAQVGGKIAQLGARLIDASASKWRTPSSTGSVLYVAPPEPVAASVVAMRRSMEPRRAPTPAFVPGTQLAGAGDLREPFGLPLVAWIGGVIYLFILILILGSLI